MSSVRFSPLQFACVRACTRVLRRIIEAGHIVCRGEDRKKNVSAVFRAIWISETWEEERERLFYRNACPISQIFVAYLALPPIEKYK